jgi:hypothetical protein
MQPERDHPGGRVGGGRIGAQRPARALLGAERANVSNVIVPALFIGESARE